MTRYARPGDSLTWSIIGVPTASAATLGFALRRVADGVDVVGPTTTGIAEDPPGSWTYEITVTAPVVGTYQAWWSTGGTFLVADEERLDTYAVPTYGISYAEFGSPPLPTTITSTAIAPQLTGSAIALIRTRFPTTRLDAGLTGVAPILATGTEVARARIAELITAAASANVGIEELP